MYPNSHITSQGFTLIELAIVLVIIGLVVGGVFVGQDLIKSAEARAQISQLDKFNTAKNMFQLKYDFLPGDIREPYASKFGFATRGTLPGQGDGDGFLSGQDGDGYKYGFVQCGEPQMFWRDLSQANLIEGSFSAASPTGCPAADVTGSSIASYYPLSRIGNNLYVYTLSIYTNSGQSWYVPNPNYLGKNFFAISQVQTIAFASDNDQILGGTGIAVNTAYNIDKKIDDGLPVSGHVIAASSLAGEMYFSNYDKSPILDGSVIPGTIGITPSATTCYDNNGNAANPVTYSLSQNSGLGRNCGLSMEFQ